MKLPFMPETWSMVLPTAGVAAVLLYLGSSWESGFLRSLGFVALAGAALMLNFFRDFERSPARELRPKEVLSPADGKIVVLETAVEGFYLKKPCVHLAIFMNPLNNHVQRAPCDGKVVEKKYYPGKFLAAYEDKADLVNEQAHLVLELGKKGKGRKDRVVIKQRAGFLCRRVKTTPETGDSLRRGERIGRILLGSRVDLFLPVGFKTGVKMGDQVRAGITPLGELP